MKKYSAKNKRMFLKTFFLLLAVVTALMAIAVCIYFMWEEAPEIADEEPPQIAYQPAPTEQKLSEQSGEVESDKPQEDPNEGAPVELTGRQDGIYTVLLVGNDQGNGNTDTMLVGRIDTVNHKMDFVSLPRDTMMNMDWNIRKLNAVYWGTVNSGGVGIDGLREKVRDLIGFYVDCYAVIDLNVFIDVVDAMGGVYFDVPQDMYYVDERQNLYIDIAAGYQLLDGYDAMGVVRYRSGYSSGDLGRIEMQHNFLKAVASQFISLGNIPNIGSVIDILSENLTTDLSAANIAFFLRQALMCSADDINFYTMPNTYHTTHGLSYTYVELYPWLEMINMRLNPFSQQITADNLNVVYLSGGWYGCTQALRGEWYFYEQPEEEG